MTEERLPPAELPAKVGNGDVVRYVAEAVVQLLTEADVEGVIGNACRERTLDRATSCNGYQGRSLDMRLPSLQPGSRSCGRAATSHRSCSRGSSRKRFSDGGDRRLGREAD